VHIIFDGTFEIKILVNAENEGIKIIEFIYKYNVT